MNFVVPTTDGQGWMKPDEAEKAWEACRKGVEDASGEAAEPRRVYRLRFVHDGQEPEAVVGEKDPYDDLTVMAIIVTATRYWICNLKRGFFKTPAPMVGLSDVRDVEDFDTELRLSFGTDGP